jgi:hypothetical protein
LFCHVVKVSPVRWQTDLVTKDRRNGFFECRIELNRKENVKLVLSWIHIIMYIIKHLWDHNIHKTVCK